MAKKYKIKRSKRGGMLYKPRPHPVKVILLVLAVTGLGYLGFVVYTPIRDAIVNWKNQPSQTQNEPLPVITEPESSAPEPSRPSKPAAQSGELKAIYLPHETLQNESALRAFLEGLPQEINSVMIDIKDPIGNVLFKANVPNAKAWGAIAEDAISLSALRETLKEQGLSLIARMSAFRDDTASRGDKGLAVQFRSPGVAWLDDFAENGGRRWLNPYHETAQQYLIDLALAAVDEGAVLIVLSDFQFPPSSLTSDAYFGEVEGVSRAVCLKTFADKLSLAVEEKGARLAAYLPASALAAPNLTLYGGEAKDILPGRVLVGALPYQFGESFDNGGLIIKNPLSNPAETVKQSVRYAQDVLGGELLVLLQGGQEPEGTVYTADQIAAQVTALSGLGVEEYILYCTQTSNYQLK